MSRLAHRSWMPWVVFTGLALLVMAPLLKPGYVLTFDMVFAPHMSLPEGVGIDYPFWAMLHFTGLVIPMWLIQKLVMLSILAAAGVGMYRWVLEMVPSPVDEFDWQAGAYVAGILFVINPFTYDRWMVGQYLILAGLAVLPWFAVRMWRLINAPSVENAISSALLLTLVGVLSVHVMPMAMLVAAAIVLRTSLRSYKQTVWRRDICRMGGIWLGTMIVLNAYWLVPLLLGTSPSQVLAHSFGESDLRAFATVPDRLGLLGSVLSLHGFWGEAKNQSLQPQDVIAWWRLPLVALFILMMWGALWSWRHDTKNLQIWLWVLLSLGCALAIGTAGTVAAPINQWLFDHFVWWRGYREPQKFVGLVLFVYGYFTACGTYALLQRLKSQSRQLRQVALLIIACLPILYAPLMPWGFHRQLQASSYPSDWYGVRSYLCRRAPNAKVLFLPWHLYMRYNFAGRVVATPAVRFFSNPILASRNPDFKGATGYGIDPVQRQAGVFFSSQPQESVGALLAPTVDASYVLVAKDNGYYKKLNHLAHDQSLQVVFNGETLELYKVIKGKR